MRTYIKTYIYIYVYITTNLIINKQNKKHANVHKHKQHLYCLQ